MPRNASCELCPLAENSKYVCLWGEGPIPCEAMIVGQNPGYEELKSGHPFVGASGKLLTEMLAQAGIERSQVYISNAVKCGTEKNREPSAKETSACNVYLQEEISAVMPRIILALGNTALRSLTGKSGITSYRGGMESLHKRFGSDAKVLPTFHPASTFHQPNNTALIQQDLRKLKAALTSGFEKIEHPWEFWEPGKHGPITDSGLWVYDTETNWRLDPKDPLFEFTMVGIDDGEKVWLFKPEYIERALASIRYHQKEHGLEVVGFNSVGFDDYAISTKHGIRIDSSDAMLAAYLLYEEGKQNLETLSTSYLGVEPWKSGSKTTDPEYVARDCRYTRRLWGEVSRRVFDDVRLAKVYRNILLPAARAMAQIHRNGVYIVEENRLEALQEVEREIEFLRGTLARVAREHGLADFNPNSHPQVAALIYEKIGLECTEFTDQGKKSTAELALKQLRGQHPIMDTLLAYRREEKLRNTFLLPYGDLRNADFRKSGRVYPAYYLLTTSGRSSCREPNIQQIPRDPRIRRMVGAPPGRTLVIADFGQIEARLVAFLSRDPNLLEAFRTGQDIHTLMAQSIVGRAEVTTEERYRAKQANFGFMYGAEPFTFQQQALKEYDLVISFSEAKRYRDLFFSQWPTLPEWYKRVADELKANNQIRSPMGRIRRLPGILAADVHARTESIRQAINFLPQNMGAEIMLLTLRELDKAGHMIVATIHDSVLIECDLADAELTAREVRDIMERRIPRILREEFEVDLDVPLVADVTISNTWS